MQIVNVPRRSVAVQRDMDLIRDLMIRIETDPLFDGYRYVAFDKPDDFPGHSVDEVTYHVDLLLEAGLVTGTNGNPFPLVAKLTWKGHEFLDDIRDPGIWASVKERTKGLTSVALTIIAAVAEAEVKKKLGLS
jgi:hypothetical protein